MRRWPIGIRCDLPLRHPINVAGFVLEAWPVQHSLVAPAVGLKVSADGARVWYAPDIARLNTPRQALAGVDLYVGDGAVLTRSLVRRRGTASIGHAGVVEQLGWCQAHGTGRAVFTHCGSGIVRLTDADAARSIRALGQQCGVDAQLARDGLGMCIHGSSG